MSDTIHVDIEVPEPEPVHETPAPVVIVNTPAPEVIHEEHHEPPAPVAIPEPTIHPEVASFMSEVRESIAELRSEGGVTRTLADGAIDAISGAEDALTETSEEVAEVVEPIEADTATAITEVEADVRPNTGSRWFKRRGRD